MGSYLFPHQERLKSTKAIGELYQNGRSLSHSHLFVKYKFTPLKEGESPLKVAVAVSKKRFKKAVDRNRVKRILREAYRLNIPHLRQEMQQSGQSLRMILTYTHDELPDFHKMNKTISQVVSKLSKKLRQIAD